MQNRGFWLTRLGYACGNLSTNFTPLNLVDLCRFDSHLDAAALPGLCEREVDEED